MIKRNIIIISIGAIFALIVIVVFSNALTYKFIGDIFYSKHNYYLAKKAYLHSIKFDSNVSEVYSKLAECYSARKLSNGRPADFSNYDSALINHNKAIAHDTNSALAYKHRGIYYFWKDDYIMALKDYSKSIILDSTDSTMYISRALCFEKLNRIKDAINDYKKYLLKDDNAAIKKKINELYSIDNRNNNTN